ncbi:UNVERIFIED_CONTAM: hypothetical protein FKN15_021624 [Acipenser sinensis]
MDITALTTLLQALEHRRETEERQREERYTALIERTADTKPGLQGEASPDLQRTTSTSTESTAPAPEHPVRNRVGSELLFRDCNPLVLLLVIPIAGEFIKTADGGQISLDWFDNDDSVCYPDTASRPTILLLPGLTGTSRESYILHMIQQSHALGYRYIYAGDK